MKVIKVEKCGVCPLHYTIMGDVKYNYFCCHPSTDGMEIENPEAIHPECKLEDYMKGE